MLFLLRLLPRQGLRLQVLSIYRQLPFFSSLLGSPVAFLHTQEAIEQGHSCLVCLVVVEVSPYPHPVPLRKQLVSTC